MTAISNVFSKEFIACASDSFLTRRAGDCVEYVETQRPKIFALDGLSGAISYWGFAGLDQLDTADELEGLAGRARSFPSLWEFARELKKHFDGLLTRYPSIRGRQRGLGFHIVGYEEVAGFKVPELFLVTNFTSPTYQEVANQLGCSRRTHADLKNEYGDDEFHERDSEPERRIEVYRYLESGGVLYFNNGDPELFNIAANGVLSSMKALNDRSGLKSSADGWRDLAKRPIEIVADLQQSFAKDANRVVGGRIHDLVIKPDGSMYSDTGVVSRRWSER